jgi:hypothetical protein
MGGVTVSLADGSTITTTVYTDEKAGLTSRRAAALRVGAGATLATANAQVDLWPTRRRTPARPTKDYASFQAT